MRKVQRWRKSGCVCVDSEKEPVSYDSETVNIIQLEVIIQLTIESMHIAHCTRTVLACIDINALKIVRMFEACCLYVVCLYGL